MHHPPVSITYMGKIALEGLEFFAFHGYQKEEKKIGNRYGVDIVVDADLEEAALHDQLVETIDYTRLYEVVRKEMQESSSLLEHIAQRIVDQIFLTYPQVNQIEITVSKFNPPIGGICKRAYVKLRKVRTQ